jgi:hypothetical protein
MINPQKGIDLMNNTSIINRILFAVTIFQHLGLSLIKKWYIPWVIPDKWMRHPLGDP